MNLVTSVLANRFILLPMPNRLVHTAPMETPETNPNRITPVEKAFFCALGALAVLAIAYIAFGWNAIWMVFKDAATAAWIQAVGSIAAIIVSVQIVQRNAALVRTHALETYRRRMSSFDGVYERLPTSRKYWNC